MRIYSIIILVFLLISCSTKEFETIEAELKKPEKSKVENIEISNDILFGEWYLDSTSNRLKKYASLFFTEDMKTVEFQLNMEGVSTTKKGMFYTDSIIDEYGNRYNLKLKDSSVLIVSLEGYYQDFYTKSNNDNYNESLNSRLKDDSLRSRLIGWWQKKENTSAVKLLNHPAYCKDLTIQFRSNGTADFYIENNFDSIVGYGYKVIDQELSFSRGCVVRNSPVLEFDENENVSFVLDNRYKIDTLSFTRLEKIKK